ncbi:hypothetical protein [Chitinophaga vietnamensis]|uniref:hypothetical protein n=1 Tax=Chitinophaga vietnamensis TaxID=2593957 RepID=UPI0011773628|nr:hypothetical protein [Chitinophaga vietnamensis]
MKQLLILSATSLLLLAACSKSAHPSPGPNPPPVTSGAFDFLKNSQWVGTYHIVSPGTQYDPPCCLQFNGDNTAVTLYSNFIFYNQNRSGYIYLDSIQGTIKSIKKVDYLGNPNQQDTSQVGIELIYAATADTHRIIISADRNQMTSSTTIANAYNFNAIIAAKLAPFPAAGYSLTGTSWKGKYYDGNSYPDVAGIEFIKDGTNNVTRYLRSGILLHDGDQKAVQALYVQQGCRVYMSGFNEENPPAGFVGRAVPYFGVLAPDGKSMWVHSTSDHSRLPYYGGTSPNNPYGPVGTTPEIIKN